MAGIYDDAPSRRMGFDADGTVGVWYKDGFAANNLSATQMAYLNDETGHDLVSLPTSFADYTLALIFPQDRELDGVFATAWKGQSTNPALRAVDSSVNSTNGIDGTWVQQVANMPEFYDGDVYAAGTTYEKFRDNIQSMAVSITTAIRLHLDIGSTSLNSFGSLHVYGTISPGETPDRILFLDAENSDAVFTKVLDYAEVPRGQTQTRTVKIKNNSSTKTINTLQMTAEDLYLNAGGFYTFSLDDVSYQATLTTIGNLAPGGTKLIYVKQVIPDGETLGLQTGRIKVSHASLS